MKKLVLLPALALFWNTARAGLWTRKRKLHCPGQANNDATEAAANTKLVQNAIGGVAVASRRTPTRF
jgi:hypothetical protein